MKEKIKSNLIAYRKCNRILKIMKISTLLFFLCLFSLTAETVYPQQAELSLNLRNVTIKKAISEIEKTSDYVFLIADEAQFELNKKTSLRVNKESIHAILAILLKDTGLGYTVVERQVSVYKDALSKAIEKTEIKKEEIEQQKKMITGKITDQQGEPIIGANILEKGTSNGTITDVDGNFRLGVEENAVLHISYIGYLTQEINTAGRNTIQITLQEDMQSLEELVVIGYGTRTQRDITSAISNIGSETISKSITMSAENAMQGTMSGVQVTGTTGNPMGRPSIRIRGTNTWGVSDPLYVVDGIPITEMGAGIEGEHARIQDVRGPLNIMTMIDPNDIESISVLKDASAAAIYGVRAANGVVLITTKKGRQDKPSVDFSSRFGVQNITQELDWLSTPEYTKFVQDIFASDPERNPNEDNVGRFDPSSPLYLGNSPTYNWEDAVRNKNAATQDYSVKVSGGTDNTDYYVSLGYSDTEGTILVNNLKRYSGAVKINTKINDWIRTGLNYRLVNASGKAAPDNYLDLIRKIGRAHV
jgi:TonB-linked SusC/RagA family outer membrane protein